MPLIQEQVVSKHQWMTMDTFTNLVTIAEMTPGPIAVNGATFVGTQMAGPIGAIVATFGCILPSCVLVTLIAYLYKKYQKLSLLQGTLTSLRPAVIAMIAKAGVTILIAAFVVSNAKGWSQVQLSIPMILYFVVALLLLRKTKINPIVIMVLCGVAEVIRCLL